MKKRQLVSAWLLIIPLFLLAKSNGKAQSFSVGHAVPLWGNTSETVQLDASFRFLTATYIHIYKDNAVDGKGMAVDENFLALFLSPTFGNEEISLMPDRLYFTPMLGMMNREYPNKNGEKLHFGLSLSYQVLENFRLYYKHISNGYRGDTNVGIDTIGLQLTL